MSQRSSRLALPYLASGQAQKHVTVNESLQRLDAVVQLAVVSAATAVQPGSPTDGEIYILPPGKTGAAWDAMANHALAYYRDGVWEEIAPREGWIAAVNDSDRVLLYTGASWLPIAPLVAPADGVATLVNAAENGFDRLQFGGSTAAFPAWKRSGAELHARLADDSAFASLQAASVHATSSLYLGSLADLALTRDAANVFAQRSGANAQTFRIYNTFTDTANYERGVAGWNGNVLEFGTENAGAGVGRHLRLKAAGSMGVYFNTNGIDRLYVTGSGHLFFTADSAYDIGSAGANRPRDVHAGRNFVAGGYVQAGASSDHYWTSRSRMFSDADGNIRLANNAQSDFGRLQFGGVTASFPALRRSGAELQVRLADDSAFAVFRCADAHLSGILSIGGNALAVAESANVLALRNGANAYAFRVYNTYTDGSNFERGAVYWVGNQLRIAAQRAGTGSVREIGLETNGAVRWRVGTGGDLMAGADNSYDIGGPGGSRPRNAYLGGFLSIADGVTAPAANAGEAKIFVDAADGDLKIVFGDGTVRTIVTD